MKRKLLIALLAAVLCLSVALLAACGCQHYYENGVCKHCGTPDANYDPNNLPCAHYYEGGLCKFCGEVDANYVAPLCDHYFVNGACNKCGEVDTNYVPVAPPSGDNKTATALRVVNLYGKNGETKTVSGTVFATDSNGYYLNDGTGSIYVSDSAAVAVGNVVYVTGTLTIGSFNKPSINATQSEVLLTDATALQPTKEYASELCKIPATASNYYKFVNLVGFVAESNGTYYVEMEGLKAVIDASSQSLFETLVGQKVTVTAVTVGYTTNWVVKVVTQNAIEVTPADLDVVADEIFAWVQTQLPTDLFEDLQLPTAYSFEPTVSFAWSVTDVAGVAVSDTGKLTVQGLSQDVTIPLTLTLTCDGKTKTHSYTISCNADFIFNYVAEQLPETFPSTYTLPTEYPNSAVKFAWSVQEGSVVSIADNVMTAQNVAQDTTVKLLLTISTDSNERSKVYDVVIKAPISIKLSEVEKYDLYTPVMVSGTVLMTAYNQTKSQYSLLIYDADFGIAQIDFDNQESSVSGYAAGDKVNAFGRIAEKTVSTITSKSIAIEEVTVASKADANYKFSIDGFTTVKLETADDYHAFMEKIESYIGTTIVKVVNPYLVYSGSSTYNFVRFGPDAISARDGYSTSINGVTKKRAFCISRNILGEKCPGLETALKVPKKSAGAKLYNDFYIYAVPMYMSSDTLQLVPLGADFYQYNA
jgi:hypothetical protein